MKESPRIIFLNRYFYPDHSATSEMLSDLAFALSRRGFDITVITSRLRYDARQTVRFHPTRASTASMCGGYGPRGSVGNGS